MLHHLAQPVLIYLGIQRLKIATGWGEDTSIARDFRQELSYLQRQPKFQKAVTSEDGAEVQSWMQVRRAGDLGDRPLIVLTAGHPYDPDPSLTKEQMARQDEMWIDGLQAEEARLSSRGKQIVVPDSGHMIPFERPDAVVSAIREVWSASRQPPPR
jgi:hypothetical protein